ncbi:serine/threonine-protein kinase [Spirillospora sp. NPDC127200]
MMSQRAASPPKRIGPYRITGLIGEGGMGVVYSARSGAGGTVAVKVVKDEYARVPEFRTRFAREIQLLGRVSSVNVVPVLAADAQARQPWLAMPFVAGPTLAERVRRQGPLRGDALTAVAVSMAEAIAAVHRAGVVHRDLKPSNVILSDRGPKIVDFGIARPVEGTAITRTARVVGTPGWLSPEQYDGQSATAASDVFAWAAVVVFAATGAGPFGRGAPEAIAARALHGEPDLAAFAKDADPVLHESVAAALRKDPAARPTAYEVMAQLVSGRDGAGDPVVAATRIIHRAWGADPTVVETASRDEAGGQGVGRRARWRPLVAGAAAGSVLTAGVFGLSLTAIGGGDVPRSGGTDRGQAGSGSGRTSSPSAPQQSRTGAAVSATGEKSQPSNAFQGPNGVSVRTAKVGDTLTLKGTVDSRLRIAATVTKVVQDAESSGFPLEGQRLVAVRVAFKNVGDVVYRDAPINGAHLIDDRGNQYSANSAVSVTAGGSVAGGLLTLTPGSGHSGYFVFPVPKGTRAAAKFQFALDSGSADDVAEWRFSS